MNLDQMKAELARLEAEAEKLSRNTTPYLALFGRISRLRGAIEWAENGFLL